jgi:hypothetical protein
MSGMYGLSESVKCPCSGSYLAYMQMNIEVCFPQLLSAAGYIPWGVNKKFDTIILLRRVPRQNGITQGSMMKYIVNHLYANSAF